MDKKALNPFKSNKFLTFLEYCILLSLVIIGMTLFLIYLSKFYGSGGMFIFMIVVISAVFGLSVRWLYKDGRLRLSHIIVLWIMLSGTAIMASTVWLAYIGSAQIAESLAATVASTMIAEAIGYAVGSAAEHVTDRIKSSNSIVQVDSSVVDPVDPTIMEQITEEEDDGSVG